MSWIRRILIAIKITESLWQKTKEKKNNEPNWLYDFADI